MCVCVCVCVCMVTFFAVFINNNIGAFGSETKGLLKGLEDLEVAGQVETIQTTALLKTARILRRVLDTWGDLLLINLKWKNMSLRWCEKL